MVRENISSVFISCQFRNIIFNLNKLVFTLDIDAQTPDS